LAFTTIILILLILITIIILSGSVLIPNLIPKSTLISTTTSSTQTTVPINKQDCEARGGEWGRFGMAQIEQCNLPTSDGGKTCTDRSQCEGFCVAEETNATVGKCTAWKLTFGCINIVENGHVTTGLCAD